MNHAVNKNLISERFIHVFVSLWRVLRHTLTLINPQNITRHLNFHAEKKRKKKKPTWIVFMRRDRQWISVVWWCDDSGCVV